MKVTVKCENEQEYRELIKQLQEDRINYFTTEQAARFHWFENDREYTSQEPNDWHTIVFWYDGRLI